MRATLIV